MKQSYIKARIAAETVMLLVAIVSGIISAVSLGLSLYELRHQYDKDAVGASRYVYTFYPNVTVDVGTYTMKKGTLKYVVEFAEDAAGQNSAESRYRFAYKKANSETYIVNRHSYTISRLRSRSDLEFFMFNSNKSDKYNIRITKDAGLDRRTRIGLLVIAE